ncbi:hypothetical protein ACIQFZ_42875, partial [Streptomyces sp. NPDC093064]|uniref:hypothetical protein n=1 Tax=Streptomyces sp. NPDC093064 TaxID=3366020 RepID=UPI0037FC9EA5
GAAYALRLRARRPDLYAELASTDATENTKESSVLRAAAGISAANLQAHRDTWAFLVKHASSEPSPT